MLKAAAWRLSRLLRAKPSTIVTANTQLLEDMLVKAFPRVGHRGSGRGPAARLVAKVLRLRAKVAE